MPPAGLGSTTAAGNAKGPMAGAAPIPGSSPGGIFPANCLPAICLPVSFSTDAYCGYSAAAVVRMPSVQPLAATRLPSALMVAVSAEEALAIAAWVMAYTSSEVGVGDNP